MASKESAPEISQGDMRTLRRALANAVINPQLHFVAGILTANMFGVANETAYIFIGIVAMSHGFVYWVEQ